MKAREILVLSMYPLSSGYRSRLEASLGLIPEYKLASDLRHGGFRALIGHLARSRYAKIILPCEVPEASCALSIMQLVAAAHRLPEINICDPDLVFRRISLWQLIKGTIGLGLASLGGIRARKRLARRAERQLRIPEEVRQLAGGNQRILYLKNNLWFGLRAGGSVGHVAGVINGMIGLGHTVRFLSPETPKYLATNAESELVPLFSHFALPAAANLFRVQELSFKKAIACASEFRPTLLYQRLSLGDWTAIEVADKLKIPVIVEYNGSELWVAKNWGANTRYSSEMTAAEDAMLRRANLVFTISEALRDELVARGIPSSRVAWYPNCVDSAQFDPKAISAIDRESARSILRAEPDDFVIMFMGTFGLWHGAEIFARAAAILSADSDWMRNTKTRFAFVGDGKTREKCSEIVQMSAAANYTVFTGLVPQHEAPKYLAAADAFVASHVPNVDGSKFFGSPTKLFEYMAMQRPIVASALDQIAAVLRHEETALLVRPGDPQALADGLRRVGENRLLGHRLAVAAREEAIALYSWNRHVTVMMDALASASRTGSSAGSN